MDVLRRTPSRTSRPGGLRARLLLSFVIPVLFLGAGAGVLMEILCAGRGELANLPIPVARGILAGFILLAILVAAALAIQAGDRFTRPVAWLLRAIDTGQVRLIGQLLPPAADWEMGALCSRVGVLLQQNLSGAKAMEELEALRSEIGSILDAAAGGLEADRWPRERATHALTRRLLGFFQAREERVREAVEGIGRLQGVLEQDWREETLAIEEIVRRAERSFLQQTQVAVELERLERLIGPDPEEPSDWSEMEGLITDLHLGIERWRREIDDLLRMPADQVGVAASEEMPSGPDPADSTSTAARLREWDAWVQESFKLLEASISKGREQEGDPTHRISSGLERVAGVVAGSSQEVSALSREVVQLQRAWNRLGERLRTLMVRVGEAHDGTQVLMVSGEEDAERDTS